MSHPISRRDFLRSAGGITFLALAPVGRGLFAAPADAGVPVFTAVPYLQPGDASRLVEGKESAVIAWQTENKPADFELRYGPSKIYGQRAAISRNPRLSGSETRLNYACALENLPLGQKVHYQVAANGRTIAEGFFTAREPRGSRVRFVALGDNACQSVSNRNVAYQAYAAHPDFVINVGDSVYEHGCDSEYTKYFFTVFNCDAAAPGVGAPLLRSVPYYSVLGNHDINFTNPETKQGVSIADFDGDPGALGYYTSMYLPANGLAAPPSPTPICGAPDRLDSFKKAAGGRYPQMANYSFDRGDIHFLCLDSNIYLDANNPRWQQWIADDLKNTDARWKFVVYHHPAFNVGKGHFAEQHMRVLSPLLERSGVDLVLNGHEHLYQRSCPLRFEPGDIRKAGDVLSGDRLVPGVFTVDRDFDGVTRTQPKGILYVTTGAGGQELHDPEKNNKPETWTHARDQHVAYVTRLVSDRHSFTCFDVDGEKLTMSQIDENGVEFDRISVTKPV